MEQLTTGILRRSSDAIIIIDLENGAVLDVNEAFFTATGYARHELVGRPGRDLIVGVGQTPDPTAVKELRDLGSITDASIGLWTRSGELRVGDMSALVLEVEGQRDALCTIRALRDPTPGQRRCAAREELDRILANRDAWPEAANMALQAFGKCLRWEFGVLWRAAPDRENLRCTAVWHAPQWELQEFEEATRDAAFQPGWDSVRRAWLRGEATWIPDA